MTADPTGGMSRPGSFPIADTAPDIPGQPTDYEGENDDEDDSEWAQARPVIVA